VDDFVLKFVRGLLKFEGTVLAVGRKELFLAA
jgi:hypothetical protein